MYVWDKKPDKHLTLLSFSSSGGFSSHFLHKQYPAAGMLEGYSHITSSTQDSLLTGVCDEQTYIDCWLDTGKQPLTRFTTLHSWHSWFVIAAVYVQCTHKIFTFPLEKQMLLQQPLLKDSWINKIWAWVQLLRNIQMTSSAICLLILPTQTPTFHPKYFNGSTLT